MSVELDLDPAELRRFIAVAEERSFRRAAERLGMAQPPLSRAIAQLEGKLGTRLLNRTTRQVSLTPAGVVLLDQARHVLDAVAAAARRTARAGQPRAHLAVALKPGNGGRLLRRLVDLHERSGSQLRIEVLVSGWGEQAAMLADGRADVAFLRGPITAPGIDAEPLFTEPRCVALAAAHPLAGRRVLHREDLARDPVPVWPAASAELAAYRAAADRADDAPRGPVVRDASQLLEAVALGQGVAFVPASSASLYARRDVKYVRMAGISASTLYVAWPDTCRSKEVARFVRLAVEVASSLGGDAAALA
ncbi:LysR family transcriptional regulator [Sorangium sp. So ce341]|uniref:LysR family transcriptional regulator n=1 Tax=Sorangium sp. So ce341 TaxID=3133302 RepID=UPI003F5E7151